jgi:hypothetical protein
MQSQKTIRVGMTIAYKREKQKRDGHTILQVQSMM